MLSISEIERPLSSTCVRPVLRGLRLRVLMPKSRPLRSMDGRPEAPPISPGSQASARARAGLSARIARVTGTSLRDVRGGGMTVRMMLALGLVLVAGVARAQNRIVLDEVLGSWLGDAEVQYVELRMLETGQNMLAGVGVLVFDDATGSDDGRRFFGFQQNV